MFNTTNTYMGAKEFNETMLKERRITFLLPCPVDGRGNAGKVQMGRKREKAVQVHQLSVHQFRYSQGRNILCFFKV